MRILKEICQGMWPTLLVVVVLFAVIGAFYLIGHQYGYEEGQKNGYQNKGEEAYYEGEAVTRVTVRKNSLAKAAGDMCLLRDILQAHAGKIDRQAEDEFLEFFEKRYDAAASDYESSIKLAWSKGLGFSSADYPEKAPSLITMEQEVCPRGGSVG